MKRIGLISLLFFVFAAAAHAQGSRFTYQGSLKVSGQPANGNFDIQFDLFPSIAGGSSVGTQTVTNVAVVNGNFTVILDFGSDVFTGVSRFLEVAFRPAGSGAYTTLAPRTEVTSVPFAVQSLNSENASLATNATNALALSGLSVTDFARSNDVRLTNDRNPTSGSPFYIQNGTTVQTGTNFNISGNGTAGTLTAGTVSATTQFNFGANRILWAPGSNNLFAGLDSGAVNTTGFGNSFFGGNTGKANEDGRNNSFFGIESGLANIGGNSNSFFGAGSGRFTQFGGFNSFFGAAAGNSNLGGSNNVFVGREAGYGNTSGNKNTALGANADVLQSDLVNATAIGANAQVAQSNSLVLGSSNGVNSATADTNVGIGTSTPNFRLDLVGRMRIQQTINASGASDSAGIWLFQRTPNAQRAFIGMQDDDNVGFYGNNGGAWGLVMNTATGYVSVPLRIGVGTTNPLAQLHVAGSEILSTGTNAGFKFRNRNSTNSAEDWVWYANGNIARLFSATSGDLVTINTTGVMTIAGLGAAGSTQLCRNASNEISSCSSSIRYKNNVQNFRPGLDLIRKLRPVSFNWKADGRADLGLVAEEVAAAEPLLSSTNEKGEVEGVKYDRVGVVLVNAVNEQQTQIDEQRATIERQQRELEAQRDLIMKQQAELDALKQFVCSQNPAAPLCVVKQQ